jgi:hypothetical protein
MGSAPTLAKPAVELRSPKAETRKKAEIDSRIKSKKAAQSRKKDTLVQAIGLVLSKSPSRRQIPALSGLLMNACRRV